MSTRQQLVTHQFNQSQQEDPVNDIDEARMTVLSPGMHSCHQFNALEKQQMAYLKIRLGLKHFINPSPNPFLIQLGDETIYPREDPIQSKIMVCYHIMIRMK